MLAKLRPIAGLIARRSTRTISSFPPLPGSTASDEEALRKSMNAVGGILSGADASSAENELLPIHSSPSSSAPGYQSTLNTLPLIFNVPPAEDPLLHYLTSSIMKHGHRQTAARITSRTLLWLHTFTRAPPLPILRKAILSASPAVRCMTHRQGAKNVHKPIPLSEKQRTRFGVQWILKASDSKPGRTLEERLARELIAVIRGESEAVTKRNEVHRFAMVNRGNAHARV